jgi:hypothetical protein
MRKLSSLLAIITLAVASLWAVDISHQEKDAVAAVARNYMKAYYTGDAHLMLRTLHPDFHKRTLHNVNGQTEITEDTVQSMVQGVSIGSGKEIPVDERIKDIEVLDVYKDAASVKVTTGRWIDYMHLSKLNGEWRVLDVVLQYTKK